MLVEFPLATRALILWAIVEKKHGSRIHALFCSVLDLLIRHEMWVLFILIYPFVPCSSHIFLLFLWLVVESSSCVFSPPSRHPPSRLCLLTPYLSIFFYSHLLLCMLKVPFKINSSTLQNHQPPFFIAIGGCVNWSLCAHVQ